VSFVLAALLLAFGVFVWRHAYRPGEALEVAESPPLTEGVSTGVRRRPLAADGRDAPRATEAIGLGEAGDPFELAVELVDTEGAPLDAAAHGVLFSIAMAKERPVVRDASLRDREAIFSDHGRTVVFQRGRARLPIPAEKALLFARAGELVGSIVLAAGAGGQRRLALEPELQLEVLIVDDANRPVDGVGVAALRRVEPEHLPMAALARKSLGRCVLGVAAALQQECVAGGGELIIEAAIAGPDRTLVVIGDRELESGTVTLRVPSTRRGRVRFVNADQSRVDRLVLVTIIGGAGERFGTATRVVLDGRVTAPLETEFHLALDATTLRIVGELMPDVELVSSMFDASKAEPVDVTLAFSSDIRTIRGEVRIGGVPAPRCRFSLSPRGKGASSPDASLTRSVVADDGSVFVFRAGGPWQAHSAWEAIALRTLPDGSRQERTVELKFTAAREAHVGTIDFPEDAVLVAGALVPVGTEDVADAVVIARELVAQDRGGWRFGPQLPWRARPDASLAFEIRGSVEPGRTIELTVESRTAAALPLRVTAGATGVSLEVRRAGVVQGHVTEGADEIGTDLRVDLCASDPATLKDYMSYVRHSAPVSPGRAFEMQGVYPGPWYAILRRSGSVVILRMKSIQVIEDGPTVIEL
jgi:hypothetical protein